MQNDIVHKLTLGTSCVFLLWFCDRNHCRLLHHRGWSLPLQKTFLTLSKVTEILAERLTFLSVSLLIPDLSIRFFCPPDCKAQPPHWSPVIGNNIYADVSNSRPFSLQVNHRAHQGRAFSFLQKGICCHLERLCSLGAMENCLRHEYGSWRAGEMR